MATVILIVIYDIISRDLNRIEICHVEYYLLNNELSEKYFFLLDSVIRGNHVYKFPFINKKRKFALKEHPVSTTLLFACEFHIISPMNF